MGHRRLGVLPKSTKWREIVASVATATSDPAHVDSLIAATLDGVRDRFEEIDGDRGVIASFKFLVHLASAAQTSSFREELAAKGIDLSGDATPLALARQLHRWMEGQEGSAEYASLSKAAASDALAAWFSRSRDVGPGLFEPEASDSSTWSALGTGSGFCDLARLYFAKFTERYLKYFLDREASANVSSIAERDRLDEALRKNVDQVSKHAFETSKITQSFAAGWFNKYARIQTPSDRQLKMFLSVAFGKMREELRREGLK